MDNRAFERRREQLTRRNLSGFQEPSNPPDKRFILSARRRGQDAGGQQSSLLCPPAGFSKYRDL
ncbi:hypothetical protein [Rhizobium rhizogenes]|uniref:Uncharacterized protein n=1 Tax=Rhizobium rhizogenes NBRC 13257 TaxID=1220581 RepID=A0AA87Q5E7_RHIRH|nr:hypothetical protein [Rhizobium rhizogenes]NTG71367.1 hypothetical protein [Rhizobium rhizogenes]TRB05109.1 hypothetical protein EXN67_25605 [Rhizobium rhizogenes]TRB39368.1 hypothetical protein EXN73_25170 [Rhizobium rhizogenes]TRB54644.1 hypothetical protein EXN71_25155 [Rhizobium rhizogenes]GAJ95553.1 hypothetical protein RRH01S_12_01100 [Rhizobium rhizogenes NBRC 13257]